MKEIRVVSSDVDFLTGKVERDEYPGYLVAPGIAMTTCCSGTLYFNYVKPSSDGEGIYDDCGVMSTVAFPDNDIDIHNLPPEVLTVALWAAKYKNPMAVAV